MRLFFAIGAILIAAVVVYVVVCLCEVFRTLETWGDKP